LRLISLGVDFVSTSFGEGEVLRLKQEQFVVDLHWGVLFCGSGGGGRVEKMETTRNSEVKGLMAGWLEKFWSRGGGGGGV